MANLVERRQEFSKAISELLLEMYNRGYKALYNDVLRDRRCPYGSRSSLHHFGLAADIQLYKDGKYLDRTEDHAEFGLLWESWGFVWGGRWQDGGHYQGHLPEKW